MELEQQRAQRIVNEMEQSIHRGINIMDRQGVIIASTDPSRIGQRHEGAMELIEKGLPRLTVWTDAPEKGVRAGINLPIVMSGELLGVIGITGAPEDVSVFGDIIQRMTELMLESIYQREESERLDRARSFFLENWLFSRQISWPEMELRGRLLGFHVNAPHTVALLRLSAAGGAEGDLAEQMRSGALLRTVRAALSRDHGHCCAMARDEIILLLRQTDREEILPTVQAVCRSVESYHPARIYGGISAPSRDAADLRRCYRQALTAADIASQLSRQLLFYDESSLEFIVQSIPLSIRRDLTGRVFSRCDSRQTQEHIRTIRTYFDQGGDIRRCADALYIHRNTFQYRIDALKKATGQDLRLPKDALVLYLAAHDAGP